MQGVDEIAARVLLVLNKFGGTVVCLYLCPFVFFKILVMENQSYNG